MEDTTVKHRQISDKSLANLKQFSKGKSGNPKGRPTKGDCLVSCLKEELASLVAKGSPLTKEQMIAKALVDKAMLGDIMAIRLAFEYTAGKPMQAVELTGKDGGPIEHSEAKEQFISRITSLSATLRATAGDPVLN